MGVGVRKDAGSVVAGDEIDFLDTGDITVTVASTSAGDVGVTIGSTAAADHIADATGAHNATAILVDSTDLTGVGVNVQTSLEEIDLLLDAAVADLNTEEALTLAYRPIWSTLTADSADVNASEVLVASGLTLTAGVGTYELEALVLVTTAAAADISLKFGGTATVTATVGTSDIALVAGASGDGTAAKLPLLLPTSWTTEFEVATTGALADTPFLFKGKLVTTVGGTIILEFTQGTSDVSNTHIDKGSYLKLQRVA